MKIKSKIEFGACLILFTVGVFYNQKFEVIAFHPFYSLECSECSDVLKVMTWNVHCASGADSVRQRRIAELILAEDADFVQLNEFQQDSCGVLDSLLKTRYSYTEEYQSRKLCGDIFYSKRKMSNSGRMSLRERDPYKGMKWRDLPDSIRGKSIQTIRATIAFGKDSVQIFGMHMASNSGDGSAIVNSTDSLKKIDSFYNRYLRKQENRCFQSKWTKVFIQESKHPVIVMGDMNDFNCSAPLDILTSAGLKDAWWEGGFGYGCTFHTGWMRLRIDHVLYEPSEVSGSKFQVSGCRFKVSSSKFKVSSSKSSRGVKLCGVKVVETDLSDHNALVAEFGM